MEFEHDLEIAETHTTPTPEEAAQEARGADDNINIDADPAPQAAETDDQAGADGERKTTPPAEDKTPAWARKRFDELTFRYNEEKRQREALEQRLNEQKKSEIPLAPFEKPKPTLEAFDYDDGKYLEALTDWKLEKHAHDTKERSRIQADVESRNAQVRTFNEKRESTMAKGIGKYEDFSQVIDGFPPGVMNVTVATALVETPNSEDVAYFLGKNIPEAIRISKLNPIQAAIEIGAISTKLRIKPTKPISNAPDPVKPINATSGGAMKDPSQMTDAEYSKWRQSRIKARR